MTHSPETTGQWTTQWPAAGAILIAATVGCQEQGAVRGIQPQLTCQRSVRTCAARFQLPRKGRQAWASPQGLRHLKCSVCCGRHLCSSEPTCRYHIQSPSLPPDPTVCFQGPQLGHQLGGRKRNQGSKGHRMDRLVEG